MGPELRSPHSPFGIEEEEMNKPTPNTPLQDAYDYLVRVARAYLETVPAQQGGGNQVTQRQVLADAVYLFKHKEELTDEQFLNRELKRANVMKDFTLGGIADEILSLRAQLTEGREKMFGIVEDNKRLEADAGALREVAGKCCDWVYIFGLPENKPNADLNAGAVHFNRLKTILSKPHPSADHLARMKRLEEALEPFAKTANTFRESTKDDGPVIDFWNENQYDPNDPAIRLTYGDFRKARAALEGEG